MKPPHTTAKINRKCEKCGYEHIIDFNPNQGGMRFDGVTDISGFCDCGEWYHYLNPGIGNGSK